MVWRTAFRLLGRTGDVEDCLQEVFLSALELSRRERIRNWPGTLRHLATARAIDRLRERIRDGRLHEDGANVDMDALGHKQTNPAEKLESKELASHLRVALAQLPGRQAEVFALHFFEQMSYRQIAETLRLKTNAVGVLLHEARDRLRVLLAKRCQRSVQK